MIKELLKLILTSILVATIVFTLLLVFVYRPMIKDLQQEYYEELGKGSIMIEGSPYDR